MQDIITVTQKPIITFVQFEEYKKRAEEIANIINNFDLTEDNIKEAKSMLAEARKLTNSLEEKRKEVKKYILEPYEELKIKVDILTDIINSADNTVRQKVKSFEELERLRKKDALAEIWSKRVVMYTFPKYLGSMFNVWCQNKYLNKTTSMNVCEKDMTDYMEQLQSDVDTILNCTEYPEDIIVEYTNHYNLNLAIQNVTNRKKQEQEIKEVVKHDEDLPKQEKKATFVVTGEKNIMLAEMLLEKNSIDYVLFD